MSRNSKGRLDIKLRPQLILSTRYIIYPNGLHIYMHGYLNLWIDLYVRARAQEEGNVYVPWYEKCVRDSRSKFFLRVGTGYFCKKMYFSDGDRGNNRISRGPKS